MSISRSSAARTSTIRRQVIQVGEGGRRTKSDVLAVEEPLEIRLCPGGAPYVQVAVTMRTPGHDFELAAGFLYTEGIVRDAADVRAISYCTDPARDGTQQYNIVNVTLRPGVEFDAERLRRNFYASSSCGVCGKASIDSITVRGVCAVPAQGPVIDEAVVRRLAGALRGAQTIFDKTGGLHAAGLFDEHGGLVAIREDVGRHNAVDKAIGQAFLKGGVPIRNHVLMVSGRASFEITQKAAAAGIPIVAAVSAPSSLACDVAEAFGMTLIGFLRDGRFSVYAGPHRLRPPAQE